MRALLITIPLTNGGDYLIEKRMIELLETQKISFEHVRAGEITGWRDLLKSFDCIITGGGPRLDDSLLVKGDLEFVEYFEDINKPIYFIGSGVYGSCGEDFYVYNKKYTQESINILEKINNSGGKIACRDYISARILKNNGIKNVLVMGCPAWYDKEFIGKKVDIGTEINKIVISDPGLTKIMSEQEARANQAIGLVEWIRKKFPKTKIVFTFNNGVKTKYSERCNTLIRDHLDHVGIEWRELSGSADGFEIYNDADMHIGFRVHSHIYCLSRNIPSILIEEDIRGYGVNEIFCLPHIYSYDLNTMLTEEKYKPNEFLLSKLNDIVDEVCENKNEIIGRTRHIIDHYYEKTEIMLKSIFNGK